MDLMRKNNNRAGMSAAEKAANRARDKELLKKNQETMKKAPKNEMGDAVRAFGDAANKKLQQDIERAAPVNKENSRAQYESEKAAGDPNALRLSFEQWKQL